MGTNGITSELSVCGTGRCPLQGKAEASPLERNWVLSTWAGLARRRCGPAGTSFADLSVSSQDLPWKVGAARWFQLGFMFHPGQREGDKLIVGSTKKEGSRVPTKW